jgi:regulator of sigma E protease
MALSRVEPGSAAEEAGLKVGDQIVRLGDRSTTSWSLMSSQLHNKLNEALLARPAGDETTVSLSFPVEYLRDGQPAKTMLVPRVTRFEDQSKQPRYKLSIGWGHMQDTIMPDEVAFPLGDRLAWAGPYSVKQTWGYGKIMVMGLVRMIEGRVSTNSLGGPILIGELAAKAGEAGLQPFLQMMALISINLAVFNMVPIPVLDGGQLLLFALEAIKRGPLSFRTRQIAMYIGFVMIVLVLLLAFKNDIERSWQNFVDRNDTTQH